MDELLNGLPADGSGAKLAVLAIAVLVTTEEGLVPGILVGAGVLSGRPVPIALEVAGGRPVEFAERDERFKPAHQVPVVEPVDDQRTRPLREFASGGDHRLGVREAVAVAECALNLLLSTPCHSV